MGYDYIFVLDISSNYFLSTTVLMCRKKPQTPVTEFLRFQQKIDALNDHLQALPFSGDFCWHYIKCDYLQNRAFPFFSEITVLRLHLGLLKTFQNTSELNLKYGHICLLFLFLFYAIRVIMTSMSEILGFF